MRKSKLWTVIRVLLIINFCMINVEKVHAKIILDTTVSCETDDINQYYRVGIIGDEFSPEDIQVLIVKYNEKLQSAKLLYRDKVSVRVTKNLTIFEPQAKKFKVALGDGGKWETKAYLTVHSENMEKIPMNCELESTIEYDRP